MENVIHGMMNPVLVKPDSADGSFLFATFARVATLEFWNCSTK